MARLRLLDTCASYLLNRGASGGSVCPDIQCDDRIDTELACPGSTSPSRSVRERSLAEPEGRTTSTDSTDQFTEMAWIKFLGIEPLEATEGRAVIRLDPQPVHLNHNGTLNAAILYALAEVAGAGAVVAGMLELAAKSYTVVKRASIEYLAPARGAVTATGEIPAEVFASARSSVKAGEPTDVEVAVDVRDSSDTVATHCVLIVAVRPRRDH
jgi:acyl-CoA thioesterase